ncbi:pulmonary surfactant-associated protein A1-like [Corticium candelabrum]|uniref:pulmonary surfactant-associated protein A1-like n=1 Tax=Corticium candelabrum TaxID=121492 RepID=UPI002E256FED|nr:pulmonary surfactant-associated protein A1-like [Corticium candelabrum]
MNIVLVVVSLACSILPLCSASSQPESENYCGACPPGRDGVQGYDGRDGSPGRDGKPGRDGVPGICAGQAEQDKKIAQLRKDLDNLTDVVKGSTLPSGARICAPGSYMALGFCLSKSP